MRHPAASPMHAPAPVKADLAFVRTFALLVTLQGVGEFIAWIARMPIPGPVIGLVLLLCLLSAAPRIEREVEAAGGLVTCALLERKSKPSMPSAKIEP